MIQNEKITTTTYLMTALRITLTAVMGVFMSITLHAQGWQNNYGDNKTDEGFALIETIDEGYLTVGVSESFGEDNDPDILVVRTDVDGTVVWQKAYDLGFRETGTSVVQTSAGNFLIAGTIETVNGDDTDILLLEISGRGELLWSMVEDRPLNQRVNDVALAGNGDVLVVGEQFDPATEDSDILYARFNASGELVWLKTTGTDRTDAANAVASVDNDFVLTGISKNPDGPDNDLLSVRFDTSGAIIWERRLSTPDLEEGRDIMQVRDGRLVIAGLINNQQNGLLLKLDPVTGDTIWTRVVGDPQLEDGLNGVVELSNGDIAATGFQVQADGIDVGVLLVRATADGDIVFTNRLGDEKFLDEGRDIIETVNGNLVIAGYNGFELTFFNDLILLKTDANGNAFSNVLRGRVYWDEDEQCDADAGEPALSNWLVRATGAEQTYFGTTDRNGFYEILVDTGAYSIEVLPINDYWASCQPEGVPLQLQAFYDTTQVDFGVKALVGCPYMEVDVSVPYLARCSDVRYTVQYRNIGTATAQDAEVVLTLDSELTYLSSGIQPSLNEGNVLTFPVGNVPPGTTETFEVVAASACDGIAVNQSVNVEARITPDTLCLEYDPDWDRSDLEVTGRCEDDSIAFSIINVGIRDMLMQRTAVVIENDIIIGRFDDLSLRAKEERTVKVPATGSTYRVFAQEAENHPFSNYATAAVEGCVADGDDFTTGQVTQFPEDDRRPSRSISVQEIREEAPVVLFSGQPKGYRGGLIDREDVLSYRIVFTNTSADTVNRVVIRDTLPSALAVQTITFGAASHPYQAEIYEGGIVKVTFDNLGLLPAGQRDTNTPQDGYIEYTIAQNPENQTGDVIENRVRVIFDYQAPVNSNIVRHEVGTFPGFVEVTNVVQPDIPGLEVDIYPNPFVQQVTFEVSGISVPELNLEVFDAQGRLVRRQTDYTNRLVMDRQGMAPGTYFFRLEAQGRLLGSGTILVQ